MPTISDATHAAAPCLHGRPLLDSYDCGEEFSLYHWSEVRRLMDEGDESSIEERFDYGEEIEAVRKEPSSEVEPSPAYRDFAGNLA